MCFGAILWETVKIVYPAFFSLHYTKMMKYYILKQNLGTRKDVVIPWEIVLQPQKVSRAEKSIEM